MCNCAVEGDTPHTETVKVFVITEAGRNDIGEPATGETGTAFSNQTIAPGKRKYVKYSFECERTPLQ